MNTSNHPQSIITNARQGRPLSARNRRRRNRPGRPALALLVIAFWVAVALVAVALLS
jgi:hypothetical protein